MPSPRDRIREIRDKLTRRRRQDDGSRVEKATRRAAAKAQYRANKTFDEGRRDPGGTGGI